MRPSAQSPASNRRTETLRSAILRGSFLIPLTLLITFSAITYFLSRSTMVNQAIRSLETIADVQENRIEAYVSSGDSSLALITSRGRLIATIDDYQLTRNPRLRGEAVAILNDSVRAATDLTSVTIFGTDLEPLLYAGSVDSQPAIPDEFVVAAAEGVIHGRVVQTRGDVAVNLVGRPVLADDEIVGIAVAGQSMEPLYGLVTDATGLGETGETILVEDVQGELLPISALRFDSVDNFIADVLTADDLLDNEMLSDAVAGIEAMDSEAVDYHGEPVFAFTRYVDSTGWGMLVLQDKAEVLRPLNIYLEALGAALIVGILLAFVAARRVAMSITAPVVKVADNARQVVLGRRDLTVETSLLEIEFLVDSFNTMVSDMDDLTESLEQRIDKRTEELEEKNAELRKVMDEKEVFLAGVSHELRSPITAMIGFIDIVTMSGDDLDTGERAEMLETISSQAADVLNLIEDLLASARAQAGTLELAAVRVDLAAQARQVIEAVDPGSRKTVAFNGGSAYATGDPARVRQIVRNLITNAMRYGGEEIAIGVLTKGDVAVLQVMDNGDGVKDEDLETIFAAYGQADSSTVADSVGLGLHVSRSLARLMGGDLDYEHRDGWSVFSVRLLNFVDDETVSADTAPIVVSLAGD